MDEITKRIALEMFGAIPAGKVFGMQIMIDPTMADGRIRFVNPVTRRYSEFPLPDPPTS